MRIITYAIQFILPYPFQSRHQEKRFAKKPGNHSNFWSVLNFLPFLIFIAISCYILFFIFVSIVFSTYLFILLHYIVFIFHFLCIFFLNFLQKTLVKTRSMPYNISCRWAIQRFSETKENAPLAQLVEHLTLNQGVQGSSPWRCTKKHCFWKLDFRGRCFFVLLFSDAHKNMIPSPIPFQFIFLLEFLFNSFLVNFPGRTHNKLNLKRF